MGQIKISESANVWVGGHQEKIVEGSMASLFALRLEPSLGNQANFFQTFTFGIIGFTVTIYSLSVGKVTNLFRVKSEERESGLISGAHLFACRVASSI